MIAQRGTRDKLEKYFDTARPLKVTLQITGRATYDFCCFGVDAADKLSDDRYMIFYNQLRSPQGEIVGAEIASGMSFTIKLDALPQSIQKLVFTGSIDGAGTMGEISAHKISIGDQITASFGGADFKAEKAITSLEIYRKGGWRFNVVARGFNGGLDALLAFYGGEQADDDDTDSAPTTAPATPNASQSQNSAAGYAASHESNTYAHRSVQIFRVVDTSNTIAPYAVQNSVTDAIRRSSSSAKFRVGKNFAGEKNFQRCAETYIARKTAQSRTRKTQPARRDGTRRIGRRYVRLNESQLQRRHRSGNRQQNFARCRSIRRRRRT